MTSEKHAAVVFTRSLYPLAAALGLFPVVDMAGRLLPLHLENAQWRFGALGLILSGSMVMLLLGLAVMAFLGAHRGHRWVLMTVSMLSGIIVLLILAALVLFGLDAIQLRSMARPELKAAFIRSAVSASLAGVLSLVGFGSLSYASFQAQRSLRGGRRQMEVQIPILGASHGN